MSLANRKHLDKIHDDLEFYEHQVSGVRQMVKMSSVILADDMGLGKSLQALTAAAVDFQLGSAAHILIVCPNYLKWNWAEEIEKDSTFSYVVYHGDKTQRAKLRADFNHDILIIGYEILVNDYDEIVQMPWDILICDEAHAIKERTSKRTKAVHRLPIPRNFLLTGSPVLNRPAELWSLLHKCDPVRFKSYWTFVYRYCVFGGFKNKQIVGTKNKNELKSILAEYMIRRLKEDVLDLPDKQYIPVYVELHPKQKKIYEEIENTLALAIPSDPNPMEIENALTKMQKLLQVSSTPACIKNDAGDPAFPDDSYKLDKAVEMCEEFCGGEGEKVVIFTQFRGVMDAMKIRLDAANGGAGIPLWQLHGDVPNEKRMAMVQEWSKSPEPGVIMVMLQMATGMNLTASRTEIFIDKLFVPKLNEQAEDRCHRIGADLTQPVRIFSIIVRGTVEARVEKINASKRRMFKTLIEDVAAWKEMLLKALKEEQE